MIPNTRIAARVAYALRKAETTTFSASSIILSFTLHFFDDLLILCLLLICQPLITIIPIIAICLCFKFSFLCWNLTSFHQRAFLFCSRCSEYSKVNVANLEYSFEYKHMCRYKSFPFSNIFYIRNLIWNSRTGQLFYFLSKENWIWRCALIGDSFRFVVIVLICVL